MSRDTFEPLCYHYDMSDDELLDTLSAAANDFARRAARLALDYWGNVQFSRKADQTIVTEADLAAQRLIVDAVARQFPHHAVLGEEDRQDEHALPDAGEAEFCWVIDPIDGTRNYFRGFPCFCTSVGVLRDGLPVVGAIYDPLADRLYHGTERRGALAGDVRLEVRDRPLHKNSLIGAPSGHGSPMPGAVHRWMDQANVRNTGSTALHLAYTAAGWLDAAYAYECKIWDVAAGWLLVREAGGKISGADGSDLFPANPAAVADKDMPFLAAGPTLHAELLATLGDQT
ncbi:MAG: inositol monophosphatase [Phycisphaerales bacterium]|nr:MAG: inositol monophosphatase [Phycisphaerales bacterium]